MLDDPSRAAVLKPSEFEKIRRLLYEKAGIHMQSGKEQLVCARLSKKLRSLGIRSFGQYYDQVVSDKSGESLIALIDALSTNYTYFFREPEHFQFLRKSILPELRSRPRVELWCAASSTGEEPYSLAFCMIEELGWQKPLRILATDISTRVLAEARKATYTAERFKDMPAGWMSKFLLRGVGAAKGFYQIKPEVTRVVEFARLNLIEGFRHPSPFPVIFCRNVMIYFDRPTQEQVVQRLADSLEPGGYLIVGHAESLNGLQHPLQYVRPAVYRKPVPTGVAGSGASRPALGCPGPGSIR